MEKTQHETGMKERLLAVALELFNRRGYAATTVREIVEAAGVTKPVLYYYFQNKQGIYLELVTKPFALFATLLARSAEEEGSAVERLLRFCDMIFTSFLDNLQVVRLMYSIYYGPPQGAPFFDFEAHHHEMKNAIRRLVEEAMVEGTIRHDNPDDVMYAVLGALNVAMEQNLCCVGPGLDQDAMRRILGVVFRGIGGDVR